MTDTKQKKIFVNENGERYVSMVPDAFFKWAKGKPDTEVGRYMHWITERARAGDEASLADVPFLATEEHVEAWEEGFSVSEHKH